MSIQPPDAIFDPYQRLGELGLTLDTRKLRADWFNGTRRSGDLLFTSGQIAVNADGPLHPGRLGAELTVEQGYASAELAMLNVLSLVHQTTGDLRLWRAFKITVACSATPDFSDIGGVVNGASMLLVNVFGPVFGAHARTGVSNIALAGGTAVEVEAIFQLRS
jgi:enamine deaminase RidA (YjgF/YER057c/UK114 family)